MPEHPFARKMREAREAKQGESEPQSSASEPAASEAANTPTPPRVEKSELAQYADRFAQIEEAVFHRRSRPIPDPPTRRQ